MYIAQQVVKVKISTICSFTKCTKKLKKTGAPIETCALEDPECAGGPVVH